MMGVKHLHDFVESNAVPNSVVDVDLIQLAGTLTRNPPKKVGLPSSKLSLVVDGECCLNRLYGGYYSDWVCGGQWIRMSNFIKDLVRQLNSANVELVVFFNGAIEPQRMNEWIRYQKEESKKIRNIFVHVNRKHTPPPKAWWIPPVGLRMAIRMMLRQMNVNVVCTIDDHRQEVIAYCRENNFHGIIADDAEYIAFAPPRLFSASQLRLTYHGTLNTKEYLISELMQALNLNNEKLAVLAALLGNYLLPDEKLKDVYKAAGIVVLTENTADQMVKKLAEYLNKINVSSDLDEVVLQIFGTNSDPRGLALKQSIQYYLDGTKDGFLRYRSVSSGKRGKSEKESVDISQEPDLDTSALASEIAGTEKNILNSYKESTACLANSTDETLSADSSSNSKTSNLEPSSDTSEKKTHVKKEGFAPVLPPVSHEVMRTLSDRHSKGLMSPYIYQILSQGEIKLPVILEDGNEIPNIYSFYKPVRQMVYAIVFNLHHHRYMASKENRPLDVDIRIKEWVFNKKEEVHKPEYVKAEPVGWGVPTIQRLWFGTLQDDKRRRLRAFLTCMRSDVQLILNPEFVPQQLLVAAVVLRYMMSFPDKKVLRKPELDAFIVTALCPEFSNVTRTQDLTVNVSSRIIQIATMFMKGVEMALLVNDACGAPIPWLMCCPWLFFDGKLFHFMCQKANTCKNLQELCDNRLTLVLRTERVRQAILEGLNVQFARPAIQPLSPPHVAESNATYGRPFMNRMRVPLNAPPANINRPMSTALARSNGRRSLGGRLEIAGVVVGSWGANYNMSQTPYEATPYLMHSSQVSPIVGDYNNFGYRARSTLVPSSKGKSYKPPPGGKKKPIKKDKKPGRGRGLTMGSSSGNISPSDTSLEKTQQNGDEKKSDSINSDTLNSDVINSDINSDLLNGNESLTDERFDDAVINGNIGLLGDGDSPAPIKTILEASSSLVGATTK